MGFIALLAITLGALQTFRAQELEVSMGEPDKDEKYPFVVTFIREHQRACSGTLIAPNWVLTAGECTFYADEHRVQYGNLSVTPSQAKLLSKIIKAVKHPSLRADDEPPSQHFTHTNLQLVLVETIPLKRYAHISAMDYKTFTGTKAEHATLEITSRDLEPDHAPTPLSLGQGIVTSCDPERYMGINSDGPMMCVAPTCDTKYLLARARDSGGPLLYKGKVIGVLESAGDLPVIRYAAVSPYIDWIHLVTTQNKSN